MPCSSAITDGTLFVIDAGRTRRDAIRQGRGGSALAGARVRSVTLNRLAERSRGTATYDYDYAERPIGPTRQSAGRWARGNASGRGR